jgi:urease accessory protein
LIFTTLAPTGTKAKQCLALSFEERARTRAQHRLDDGRLVAFCLPRGTVLRHGDVLLSDEGEESDEKNDGKESEALMIVAASEPLLRVQADAPLLLLRAAYHLGNRHCQLEVQERFLQLPPDPVLRDMLLRLGLSCTEVMAPYQPEHGAYGGGHRHGHDADFATDYTLAQAAYRAHEKPVDDRYR